MDLEKLLDVRSRIQEALEPLSDDGITDSGIGAGAAELWVTIDGVEYYLAIKPPRSIEDTNDNAQPTGLGAIRPAAPELRVVE